jgi:hypothetical protein
VFSSTAGAVPDGPRGRPRMRWPMLEPLCGETCTYGSQGAGRAARPARLPDAVNKPSSVIGLRGSRAPSWHRLRRWSSGRGHSSVRGRRVRPPQVGVRQGPGASISEAAWSPIEQARPVTAEGLSMSPLPRVPAGRFRRSGTGDRTGTAGCWPGSPLRKGSPGRRSDRRGPASGREGVKAGEAPGAAGPGLDGRASRCGTVIIGSMPRPDQLRPRHRRARRSGRS